MGLEGIWKKILTSEFYAGAFWTYIIVADYATENGIEALLLYKKKRK